MIKYTKTLVGVVIFVLVSISVQHELVFAGINWTEEYKADLLPQDSTPSWRRLTDPDPCVHGRELIEVAENGILSLFRSNQEVFYVRDDVLEAPFTIELSMKVNFNNYQPVIRRVASVYFGAVGLDARVDFYPDNIAINTSPWTSSSALSVSDFDTTEFHTYRFTYSYGADGRKGVLNFYIDDQHVGEIDYIERWSSGLVGPWGYTPGKLIFGEGGLLCWNHSNTSESEWDFVRFFVGEAIEPTTDADGDGVPDEQDNCVNWVNPDQTDADGDGSGDSCDVCPFDAENDGDGDGVCGDVDNCLYAANPDQADTDGDGVGDLCNDSDDNDGDEWNNSIDNCGLVFNPDQADADNDGLGDVCDACPMNIENDSDGDGLCESEDNCPEIANPSQVDTDHDQYGDVCDTDDDNDSVADQDDNCPLIPNVDQSDLDQDGVGDECDTDDDNDGVLDADDQCLFTELGEVVDYAGCSVGDICPCENQWKNHGAYVKCVAHTAEDFVSDGLIPEIMKGEIVSSAAQSDCGHKKR